MIEGTAGWAPGESPPSSRASAMLAAIDCAMGESAGAVTRSFSQSATAAR